MDKNDRSSSTIDRCEFVKFAPPLPARLHEHDELGPRSVRTTQRFQATKDAAFQGRKCFRLIPILFKVTIIILLILQIHVSDLLVANWTKQGHQNQQNPRTVLITWSILMTMSCQSFMEDVWWARSKPCKVETAGTKGDLSKLENISIVTWIFVIIDLPVKPHKNTYPLVA